MNHVGPDDLVARLPTGALVVGAVLAIPAMHGMMHDADGTVLLTVRQSHLATALPGLPWLVGLLGLLPAAPRRLACRAALAAAGVGAAALFVANLAAADKTLHEEWDVGVFGLGILVVALPIAAFSMREVTSAWVRVTSVAILPSVILGTSVGNALVDGGGEWVTNILLLGGIAVTHLGLAVDLCSAEPEN